YGSPPTSSARHKAHGRIHARHRGAPGVGRDAAGVARAGPALCMFCRTQSRALRSARWIETRNDAREKTHLRPVGGASPSRALAQDGLSRTNRIRAAGGWARIPDEPKEALLILNQY